VRSTSMPTSRFTLSTVQCVSVRNVDHVSLDGPVDCYFTMQLRPCQSTTASASTECDCLSYVSPVSLNTLVAYGQTNTVWVAEFLSSSDPPFLFMPPPSLQ
jgi:hypothetical protein